MSNKVENTEKNKENSKKESQSSNRDSQVVNALRLGWVTSEVIGLVRQGALKDAPMVSAPTNITGRLTISDGLAEKKKTRRFKYSFSILLHLAESLDVYDPEKKSPLGELADQVNEYLAQPRDMTLPSLGEVRNSLEQWGMDAWARLSAENALAARAFTYGASIADTYWFMRNPTSSTPPQSSEETWKELLKHGRMNDQSKRIHELRQHLPPYLADALTYSLSHWGIEPSLRTEYAVARNDGRKELPLDTERKLYANLRSQNRMWRQLVLGEKTPTDFLSSKNESAIRNRHWFVFIILTIIFTLVFLVVSWLLVRLAFDIIPNQLNEFLTWARSAEDNPTMDILELVVGNLAILAAVAGAFVSAGIWLFRQFRALYKYLQIYFTAKYLQKKTFITWNREIKK